MKHHNLRNIHTRSIHQKLRRLLRILPITQMRHDIPPIQANRIPLCTIFLPLTIIQLPHTLRLERVSKQHGRGDLICGQRIGCVVHDHAALRVAAKHDFGVGTLLEGLFDEGGHFRPTRGAEGSVALFSLLACAFCAWIGGDEREMYGGISGVIHALHGHLVVGLGGQLLRDGGSNDGAHVAQFGGAAGEDEGQGLAFIVVRHAVLGGPADFSFYQPVCLRRGGRQNVPDEEDPPSRSVKSPRASVP